MASPRVFSRLVLFGASGDLTSRLLLPGLAHLVADGSAPGDLEVLGVGREAWTTDEFRAHIADALDAHAAEVPAAARAEVVARLSYRTGDVTDAGSVREVLAGSEAPQLVYLALPPQVFEPALLSLAGAPLPDGSAVAIEKPFGSDLATARRLNEVLQEELPATQVFRIDHFLTDELVENLLALRGANQVFEPLLDATHVEQVEISWLETLALEGRAGYYDRSGALRDMIQNHLLMVLALFAMEIPTRLDQRPFRSSRAAVLYGVPSPTAEQIRIGSVRGRYTAGVVDGRRVPSYVDEPGVDPSRDTETYAAVTLGIHSRRWAGVPFVLRSGKALASDRAEILVRFAPVPAPAGRPTPVPNVLRIDLLEPRVQIEVNTLASGRIPARSDLVMSMCSDRRPAYANMLLDMLNGDTRASVRGDEAEEAWRIVEPVLDAWAGDEVPLLDYPAGSHGPS